ncbi:MAG: orotidine-5'-phosphate decarboxylase [Chthoniobacterales bacterium]
MNARERIIVALDVPTAREAMALVEQLGGDVSVFKVGLQLYTSSGPEIVRGVQASGAQVFLDLKLHDIPNTVAKAVVAAGGLGVHMLTVHLSGGREMLRAADAARAENLTLLGVTVLTSATDETLRECGFALPVAEQVPRLAELGLTSGINGFVTSAHEVEALRTQVGEQATLVVPGVRPAWWGADDQKRVMTPREAIDRGADYIVIGRPITAHSNPREALTRIVDELYEAPSVA